MRAAVSRAVKSSAGGLPTAISILTRMGWTASRPGMNVATCIIGQSSGCLFLPLFALAAAQALGTALAARNPSTTLTFQNYNNSKWLSRVPGPEQQLACGLRHHL
jgi:hypothetical protein